MTVTSITKDPQALTMTVVAELAAAPARAWQLWSDPRQLERWWGPPTWPATFIEHDLRPGGRFTYVMTGPNGEKAPGWWTIHSVVEHVRIEAEDGFTGEDGEPDLTMPVTRMTILLEQIETGTRATILSRFADAAQMTRLLEMGMAEGMEQAMGQMDAILAG